MEPIFTQRDSSAPFTGDAPGTQENVSTGRPATVLILGLGNPMLGDDGVGWQVAELVSWLLQCERQYSLAQGEEQNIEVDCVSVSGLSLMERMVGYRRVILIDAFFSAEQMPGTITSFPLSSLLDPTEGHLTSAHDTSLHKALEVGRQIGAFLPEEIQVVAIHVEKSYEFSDVLTPAAASAVRPAARIVIKLLHWMNECNLPSNDVR